MAKLFGLFAFQVKRLFFVYRVYSMLIFMDDARVSTIKYGAIKQFYHYKIVHTQNEHTKWRKYP